MTNKEKIIAEIERLRKNLPWGGSAVQMTMECNCKNEAYTEIEKFINSLSEESVSEDFEAAIATGWKGYVDRGAAKVDALEDNTQELAFAKGFYRGAQWQQNKQEEQYDLIQYWFEHIAQIADDRMTATGQRMTGSHALDEIKAIAKDSVYYIKNHLYDNSRTESTKSLH